jgi:anti-sigma factor RsiW
LEAKEVETSSGLPLRWKIATLLACLLVLMIGTVILLALFWPQPVYNMDSQEVFASHLLALQEKDNLLDIESSDPRIVQAWFASRLDFVPPVRDLSAQGFYLAGARLDYMHDRPVAALVYRHEGSIIDLFIWPGENHEHGFERAGLYLMPWNDDGLTFWAISDLDQSTLQLRFAGLYQMKQP